MSTRVSERGLAFAGTYSGRDLDIEGRGGCFGASKVVVCVYILRGYVRRWPRDAGGDGSTVCS